MFYLYAFGLVCIATGLLIGHFEKKRARKERQNRLFYRARRMKMRDRCQ